MKFIRKNGHIIPIRDGKGSNGSTLKKSSAAFTVAGASTIVAKQSLGSASAHFGMKANEYLSKIVDLRKEGTRLADAANSFRGAPSSKGKEMAVGFLRDSRTAFTKAASFDAKASVFGKLSTGSSFVSRNAFTIGGGLLAAGLVAAGLSAVSKRKVQGSSV